MEQETQLAPAQPITPPEASRTNNVTPVLLLILVIAFLASTVFLALQNYQLRQQIAILQLPPAPTAAILPTPISTSPTISSPPPARSLNYPKPATWQTVSSHYLGISLCLPPKWEFADPSSGQIYFARDPNYRPAATYIDFMLYKGGSRREEYVNAKVQYEPDPEELKKKTTVKEWNVNGKSVLEVAIPSFPEVLLFSLNDRLYSVSVSYDPMVNDSKSAFRKDIFTLVGCIKSL